MNFYLKDVRSVSKDFVNGVNELATWFNFTKKAEAISENIKAECIELGQSNRRGSQP